MLLQSPSVLHTAGKKSKREAPSSFCLCYRHDAKFFFWRTTSPSRVEALMGPVQRWWYRWLSGPAQQLAHSLGVQLCTIQCRLGTQTCSFGELCAQHLLFLQYLQSAFIVLEFRIYLKREIYLSIFTPTSSCRASLYFCCFFNVQAQSFV